uniref:FBA_2 domain-containing protein n=1 Tax=Caenorhabditis tropicalis TaxID=1561998 RepID=A0A1I7TGK5_9PELO
MAERVDDIWDRMKTIAQEGSLLMLDGVVQKSHNFLEYDKRMLKRAAERYRGTISLDKVEYSLSPVAGGSSVQGTNGDLMVIFVKQQTISGLLLINWKGYVPSHIETLLIEAISGR